MKNLPPRLKNLLNKLSSKQYLIAGICFLMILINCIAITKEIFFIPLLTAGAVLVYLLVFHLDWVMYLMAFCTPFSVIWDKQDIHIGISLPAEVIMIALTFIFLFHILLDWHINKKILKHPISIAIYAYLTWMFITCITSTLPVVSFKFLASKLWFTTACYWMVIQLFKDNMKDAVKYINFYAVALAIVVIITTCKHALSGFDERYAHWVMKPFYNDHTAYGAILAFFLPITTCCFFLPENSKGHKILYAVLSAIFLMALYLSFSRAAWISIIIAIGVWCILKLRIKLSHLIVYGLIIGGFLAFYADDILYKMSRNSQDSSGNLVEQLQSISNISTDASNVERLNRWNSAFPMIKEKPVFGWGPGTYQFQYAPFQNSKYKTIISTNLGDGGNAHSEYIGPCAETGVPGMLTVFGLLFCSLIIGLRTYNHTTDKTDRLLCLMMTLSLFTYFSHGALNNFLDTDKLSLPFWGAFAFITMLNLKMKDATAKNMPAPQNDSSEK